MPSQSHEPAVAAAIAAATEQLARLHAGDFEAYLEHEPTLTELCSRAAGAPTGLSPLVAAIAAVERELGRQAAASGATLSALNTSRRSNAAYNRISRPEPLGVANA